ncbi:MAG: hypothetical protein RLZZ59_235 [Pseudomonadota bacterium]|jgi:hypothetical protein
MSQESQFSKSQAQQRWREAVDKVRQYLARPILLKKSVFDNLYTKHPKLQSMIENDTRILRYLGGQMQLQYDNYFKEVTSEIKLQSGRALSEEDSRVHFFNETEKLQAKLLYDSSKKCFVNESGEPLNYTITPDSFNKGSGFVFDVSKAEIYVFQHQRNYTHHSSIFGGKSALGGTISIVDGKIAAISNNSGHYRTSEAQLYLALEVIRDRYPEVISSNAQINIIDHHNHTRTKYSYDEFIRSMEKIDERTAKTKLEGSIDGLIDLHSKYNDALERPIYESIKQSILSNSDDVLMTIQNKSYLLSDQRVEKLHFYLVKKADENPELLAKCIKDKIFSEHSMVLMYAIKEGFSKHTITTLLKNGIGVKAVDSKLNTPMRLIKDSKTLNSQEKIEILKAFSTNPAPQKRRMDEDETFRAKRIGNVSRSL